MFYCCRYFYLVDISFEQGFPARGLPLLRGSDYNCLFAVLGDPRPPSHPTKCSKYKSVIIKFIGNRILIFHQLATVTNPIVHTVNVTSNSDILKNLTHLIFLDLNLNDPNFRTCKNLNNKLRKILGNINYSYINLKKLKLNLKSIVPLNDQYVQIISPSIFFFQSV